MSYLHRHLQRLSDTNGLLLSCPAQLSFHEGLGSCVFKTTFDYFRTHTCYCTVVDCDDTPFVCIAGCISAVAEARNAKWSLKAGTRDNFEPTLVVAGYVRGVVVEEGYVQYKFCRCQAKLVVNKRWSLTRVVVQEGNTVSLQ